MEMAQVKQAAEKARQTLSARRGVLSVGHGLKRTAGRLTEIPCVVVYVEKKAPMSALSAAEVIPLELDGVATDVMEVRTVDALTRSTGSGQVFHAVYAQRKRPCPGGYSIGHPLVTAGTLGLPMVMRDGKRALLTNAHVASPHWVTDRSGQAGEVKVGDPICQPGPYDGGRPEDAVARLLAWAPIDPGQPNRADCALALVDEPAVDWRVEGVPSVYEKTADAQPGDKVIKVGRTTGLTKGQVVAVGAAVNVNYGPFTALFVDQLEIASTEAKPFSRGGDSGSAILSEDGKAVLGLLFAGDDTTTFANPIALVQQALAPNASGSKGFDIVPRPVGETIETQLAALAESLVRVWGYDAAKQQWRLYDPLIPAVSDLKVLEKAKAYWVKVVRDISFSYHEFTYDLFNGWNLIAWMG